MKILIATVLSALVVAAAPVEAQTSASDSPTTQRLNRALSSDRQSNEIRRLQIQQQRRARAQSLTRSLQGTPAQARQQQRSQPVQGTSGGLYQNQQ